MRAAARSSIERAGFDSPLWAERARLRRSLGESCSSCSGAAASSSGASGVWSSFTLSSVSAIGSLPTNLGLHVDAALLGHCQPPREVALRLPQPSRVLQLAGGVLEPQVEQLPARVVHELHELRVLQVMHLDRLRHCPAPSRVTNLVRTGSL